MLRIETRPNPAARRGLCAALLVVPLLIAAPAWPQQVAACPTFPIDNIWNAPVDDLPVDPSSDDYIQSIGPNTGVHPDFGTVWQGAPIGIPYVDVPASQPFMPIVFTLYGDESDPGPYPVPPDAPIEGGPGATGDRHVLVVQRGHCVLYELYRAWPRDGGAYWDAGSGAVFDLRSHTLRPAGWTSADAAGLPILPGLVRYEEVAAGEIRHALRFTAPETRQDYVWPARHFASDSNDPALPPMGQRFRLRADFDLSGFSPHVRVILQALKTYGMMLADNGSPWYITGVPDSRWDDDTLVTELAQVKGSDFVAVDVSSLMIQPDSGEADFPCSAPQDLIIANQTLTGTATYTACGTLSAGPNVTVAAGSDIQFRAGQWIALDAGFHVAPGAQFSADVDPRLWP